MECVVTRDGRSSGPRAFARSAALALVAGSGLLVSACTVESTHQPNFEVAGERTTTSRSVASAGVTSAQAYAATTATKVEASVDALAQRQVALHADPDVAAKPESFNVFREMKRKNQEARARQAAKAGRIKSVRTQTAISTSAKRRPPARVARAGSRTETLVQLPGVREDKGLRALKPVARETLRRAKKLSEPVRVASAAALARIGRHGLRTQHSKVSVGCLEPQLVSLIKRAERHFGRHAVVTSGYRSRRHNRRIGGARRSMHTTCKAADIQIAGVTKWQLASWLRKQDGRGGVGTYCHTRSVHIDIGEKRDWNWRCKRRRGKRRRA